MLHLFVAPTPFGGWDKCPYDGTTLSQLLAVLIVIVSVGALALTVCYPSSSFWLAGALPAPERFFP